MKFEDKTGEVFGMWKVVDYAGKSKWNCVCECGTAKKVNGATLKNGTSKNCGCLRIKHGLEGTKIYRVWSRMKERCNNQKRKDWSNYGGRGIEVCDEWKESKNFIDWAINNGYEEGLSIDRIDCDGNYEPTNCRFITMKDQQRNKRNNLLVEIDGYIKPAAQWAEENGIGRNTIYYRIKKGITGKDLLKPTK